MPRANDFSATSISEPGREKLRVAGCILSGLTVVVIGVGIFVVQGHLTGRYVLDRPVVSACLPDVRAWAHEPGRMVSPHRTRARCQTTSKAQ
jgi:hypothetical protein